MKIRLQIDSPVRMLERELSPDELSALSEDERKWIVAYAKRDGPSLAVRGTDIASIRAALHRDKVMRETVEQARAAAARELQQLAPELGAAETMQRLAQRIAKPFEQSAIIVRRGTKHFNDLKITPREDPRSDALALRVKIIHHVFAIVTSQGWPSCVRPAISDVVRIEDYGFGKTPEKCTGVVVTLICPATVDHLIIVRSG